MAEALKLLYIVVVDEVERGGGDGDGDGDGGKRSLSFRYTRPVLQSTLQLMGCKARHAFKVGRSMRSAWCRSARFFILLLHGPTATSVLLDVS